MPVHTIRDLPSDNNNNPQGGAGGQGGGAGGGRSLGGSGGRALGGGRSLGGSSNNNTNATSNSSSGRVLGSGEAVSYQPSSDNYVDGSGAGGNSGGSGGGSMFGGMFGRLGNMFSQGSGSTSGGGNYTATGQPVDVESQNRPADPLQQQYNMNEDMFWSYNLHGITPQWYHTCLMCCCPCFVGPPCSPTRKQDYKNMLKTFCFWISIVQIIYFIVEVSVGGIDSSNPSVGPSSSTLLLLGAKSAYKIKKEYQIWRLFVPLIMHAGFLHLFMNLFVQLMICMGYEKTWKWYRVIPIYLIAGVGGNLLSCVALPDSISVGASGAIMGLIGAKVANIIIRWKKIPTQPKIMQCISVGFIIVITLLWSFSDYVDYAGHLGGLMCGFIVGFACFVITEIADRIYKWTIFAMSIGLTLVIYLTLSLVFGLVTTVSN